MFSDSQEMQLFWLSLGSKFAVCTSFIVPCIQKTLSYMVPWTLANELGFAQRRITSHNLAIILTRVYSKNSVLLVSWKIKKVIFNNTFQPLLCQNKKHCNRDLNLPIKCFKVRLIFDGHIQK